MGGGGGDNFEAQAAAAEAKKQAARDALNLQFGVAPSSTSPLAPNRSSFTTPATYVTDPENPGLPKEATPPVFDQTGWDAASKSFGGLGDEAAKNKAARDALYGTVRDDAFNSGRRRLDEGESKAARDLKFTLFGQGLNGGSVDVDQNALLHRTYDQGLLDLGGKADATAADLRSNDEQTRLGLLQSIDAGLDQGSAISSSIGQLKVNSDRAAAAGQGTSLGDLFGNAGLLYTQSQAGRGYNAGSGAFPPYSPYGYGYGGYPNRGRGIGGGNSGGIISSTGGP